MKKEDLIWFVKKMDWLFSFGGWGNGYVAIPPSHPLYGKSYDEIHELYPELEVHGGLTFSEHIEDIKEGWHEITDDLKEKGEEWWIVGFDTAHYGDNMLIWDKEAVIKEAKKLYEQLKNYEKRTF